MKKAKLFLGLLSLIAVTAKGQVNLIFNADSLKKYEGKWQWIDKKDTFVLVIKMDTLLQGSKLVTESRGENKMALYAWHKFVQNGVVLENTLPAIGNLNKSSGVGVEALSVSTNYLNMAFTDYMRDRSLRVFLKIINIEKNKAVWESWPQERVLYPQPKPKIWEGRTIPSPIILTKISK